MGDLWMFSLFRPNPMGLWTFPYWDFLGLEGPIREKSPQEDAPMGLTTALIRTKVGPESTEFSTPSARIRLKVSEEDLSLIPPSEAVYESRRFGSGGFGGEP